MTIKHQNASRHNSGQLGPGVNDVSNRYTEVVFEAEIARPARNRMGERGGERQAEEGLWRDPRYSSSFVGGADVQPGVFEVAQAPNARVGRLASGQANPAWNAIPQQALQSFATGSSGDPGQAHPYPWPARDGGRVPVTPLRQLNDAFARGESQNTHYVSVRAGQADGRIARHNQAEIDR